MSRRKRESRTDWAERYVEEFISKPFVSEFVFRSVMKNDPTQKEVIDFLVMHQDSGILISQKAQNDPEKRTVEKNQNWVRANAKTAFGQLSGALRPTRRKPCWCEHPRRGRVEFSNGLPPIIHGIVTVETLSPVNLQADSIDLPLRHFGVPISYISLSDFGNMVKLLGTIPDLLAYLDARLSLPLDCLRIVGDEKCLVGYYLLHGSLAGCFSHEDAKLVTAARDAELQRIVRANHEEDYFSGMVEYVAHCLSTRNKDYAEGISDELQASFDPTDARKNYINMQEVIASLRRAERAAIGRGLLDAAAQLEKLNAPFLYRSLPLSTDWVFVLAASKNEPREELLSRMTPLMRGAMACYEKRHCMVVIDRDGQGYEVALSRPDVSLTPTDYALGEKLFAHLRMVPMDAPAGM